MTESINPRFYHVALAAFCITIFILSSIPGDKFPEVDFEFSDKIVHVAIYAVLYILFFYSLKNQGKSVKLRTFAPEFSLLFTSLYGVTDELHQLFVRNRSCDFYDWVADTAGALVCFAVVRLSMKRKSAAAILILCSIMAAGCSSGSSVSKENAGMFSITEQEAWQDLMPTTVPDGSGFRFHIVLNSRGESDTIYEVRNMSFSYDKIIRKGIFFRQSRHVTSDGSVIDLSQSDSQQYFRRDEMPESIVISFDIYRGNKFIQKISSLNLKIKKVY